MPNDNEMTKKELLELLKKYNERVRRYAMEQLLDMREYREILEKGLPFFTKEELNELEKKYQDGMTWHQIEKELFSKGMILKRPTFRKWVQEGLIPSTVKYTVSRRGREAKYPPDIIKHINFYKYLQFNKTSFILYLMKLLSEAKTTALESVESHLEERFETFDVSICDYICIEKYEFLDALEEALSDYPNILKKAKVDLEEIVRDFRKLILPKIGKLKDFLASQTIPVFDTYRRKPADDTIEENNG